MRHLPAVVVVALALAACGGNDAGDNGDAGDRAGASSTTLAVTTTTASPATTTDAVTTSTTATTVAPTTIPVTVPPTAPPTAPPTPPPTPAPTPAPPALWNGDVSSIPVDTPTTFGTSVQGRPLVVIRRGDPAGKRILVVGAIHGNENDGIAIVDQLMLLPVPPGVELWLVPAVNPDGVANDVRQNANGVDLNRNFPEGWGVVGEPGVWEYSGPSAASEPETQATVALGAVLRPDLTLWYHQDLFRISPGTGRQGQVRARYAALTGLPLVTVSGGTYTGTASQWSRSVAAANGVGFTVELGPTLSAEEALIHANAVLTVATEL